jgi:hypothetical protein
MYAYLGSCLPHCYCVSHYQVLLLFTPVIPLACTTPKNGQYFAKTRTLVIYNPLYSVHGKPVPMDLCLELYGNQFCKQNGTQSYVVAVRLASTLLR